MNAIKRFFLRLLILLIAAGMVGAMLVLFINSRVKHSTEDQILYLIQGETEISALGQESLNGAWLRHRRRRNTEPDAEGQA